MEYETLDDIFADDPFEILELKEKAKAATADERLATSFEEISVFVDENGREPKPDPNNIKEFTLYQRLLGIRSDALKTETLIALDRNGLLSDSEVPSSIDDILNSEGILDEEESIFDLKHVPKDIQQPDYKAVRKKCKNFDEFEPLFKQCHLDLLNEKRKLKRFTNEQQIRQGEYFVQSGVLVLVNKVGKKEVINGHANTRLHVVYENGTESDLLLRSLASALYIDGKRVTENTDNLLDPLKGVETEDIETGYIYVLRSLSDNPKINSIENLYKIGFSRGSVDERIKNAEKDPTYLMAPVEVIEQYRLLNVNVQKFEHLLHKFFGEVRLDAEVVNIDGFKNSANEWFVVPFKAINTAVDLLVSGEIVNYNYDPLNENITTNE